MGLITRSSGSPWRTFTVDIAAGASEDIDVFDFDVFTVLEYHIGLAGGTESSCITVKFLNQNNSITSQVYGKMGKLKYTLAENTDASSLTVTLTNNEVFPIVVTLVRLRL